MAIVRTNKNPVDKIREAFEQAKRSGNIGEVKSLQDELFCLRSGSGGGLVVNEENSSLQREVTGLIVEMDDYISDLSDRVFEDDEYESNYGEEMEY